jgi:hypothetical protein
MVCNRCNIDKSLDDYYKNPRTNSRKDTICKSCKKAYAIEYRKLNPDKVKSNNQKYKKIYIDDTGGYAVYYLPEEHYVGFTNSVKNRIREHSKRGRMVTGYEVIAIFESPIDAHLFETMLHQRGYHGFQHKY